MPTREKYWLLNVFYKLSLLLFYVISLFNSVLLCHQAERGKYVKFCFFSYILKNLKSSNLYRSYNPSLRHYPWLDNRPKRFVAHCIQKMSLAEDISNGKVTQEDEFIFGEKLSIRRNVSCQFR